MILSAEDLAREAYATGFSQGPLEKVVRLISLLDAIGSHPFLKSRIVLKGGTALNLFHFRLPRLSVDIDLNYIGGADRETMLLERPKVEQAIQAVCSREGLTIRRAPDDHAGGKWRLSYEAAAGGNGNLELDLNFMLRTPLWPPLAAECCQVGSFRAAPVQVLDIHELAAGKMTALLARNASRDLFDANQILAIPELDRRRMRFGFVIYGALNRKDWRTVSIDDVRADHEEVQRSLIPMLRADLAPAREETVAWVNKLVDECRQRLDVVLPLEAHEREFLERLNGQGEIAPDLLSDDPVVKDRIRNLPGLLWKAQNVKQHLGLAK